MFKRASAFDQNLCRWDKSSSASDTNFCLDASCGTSTCQPTQLPSLSPSPSQSLSNSPSHIPSLSLSQAPFTYLSSTPTSSPSQPLPSNLPSQTPTFSLPYHPSIEPTLAQSLVSSSIPTISPTLEQEQNNKTQNDQELGSNATHILMICAIALGAFGIIGGIILYIHKHAQKIANPNPVGTSRNLHKLIHVESPAKERDHLQTSKATMREQAHNSIDLQQQLISEININ